MCLCVLSISTICIVTNGCKSYSFIVTLLKLLEILYGRSQRKEKKLGSDGKTLPWFESWSWTHRIFFRLENCKLLLLLQLLQTINHHAKELIIVLLEGQVDKTSLLHAKKKNKVVFFTRTDSKEMYINKSVIMWIFTSISNS